MDKVTLALAKSFALKVAAGFSAVSVDEETSTIHFTLNDGQEVSMKVPIDKLGLIQDNVSSLETTYSSEKINELIQNLTGDKGDKGDPGAEGKSAYEIAVDNGFNGTETEWLESLKGKDGEDGEDGAPGKDGEPGTDGTPGTDGYSPTATIERLDNKTVITIVDKNGETTAEIFDGKNGENGKDGENPLIDIIKVNGEELEVDSTDKSVDITIPSIEGLASEDFVTEGFVAKEDGKVLSTNDFSDEDKNKLDGLSNYDDTNVTERLSNAENAIGTLNGSEDGSVTKTVTDEIAKVIANAPEDFDTLKEISDWISSHADDASAMNTAIQKNVSDISSLQTEIGSKANSTDVESLQTAVSSKAEFSDVTALQTEVNKKANSTDMTTELNKKIDKVTSATSGDIAIFNSSGNVVDSGKKPLSVSVSNMTVCFTEG